MEHQADMEAMVDSAALEDSSAALMKMRRVYAEGQQPITYRVVITNMGMVNNVKALEHIREAVRLEPGNTQYRMLLNRMEGGGSWYETQQGPFGGMPTGGGDMCMNLCLANAFCSLCCPGSSVLCC